jgi:aspartyl-tRNA(Asn)/glutamyl-tRNA(Gln) amidotransferase subunit B
VSVRRKGEASLGTKTEVKNLNSFRFVEKALEFEINRQIDLLESGSSVVQETLLWDAAQGVAVSMRSKEEAHDYRYFPDPDLVPVLVDDAWIHRAAKILPEDPMERRDRFVRAYRIPAYDADILTSEKALADYFENAVGALKSRTDENFKMVSNWTMGDVLRVVKTDKFEIARFPVRPSDLGDLINLIADKTISGKIAKEVFDEMVTTGESPRTIIEKRGLVQLSDAGAIGQIVDDVIARNRSQVDQFLGGKIQVFGFLVGETMKATKGKANPALVNELLRTKLDAMKS